MFALLDKRKNDLIGYMTWSQGFVSGFWITIVVVIHSPFAKLLTHTVMTPDFFDNITEYAVQSGRMTHEETKSYFSQSSYPGLFTQPEALWLE